MISHDQPTIFGNSIIAAVSSVGDGPMNFRGNHPDDIRSNRAAFLASAGIDPLQATLLQVTFGVDTSYQRYVIVDESSAGEGILEPVSDIEADALIVARPDQAILLPLADCIGAIIYDPVNQVLMVSHLGRHSTEVNGGEISIRYLEQEFGSDPGSLLVWLSPAVGRDSYPLRAFNGQGLHEVSVQQMIRAGVNPGNIEVSHVDTAENPEYFSHSEFLAGNRPSDDRFAVVAMLTD